MGQCFGRTFYGRRRRHFRHKAFEFAPKRSWKYKDANLVDDTDTDSANEGILEVSPIAPPKVPAEQKSDSQSDSEEEIDTGEVRRSGVLVFGADSDDGDSGDEAVATSPPHVYRPLVAEEARERTASNSSQTIGRFEVMDIEEEAHSTSPVGNHSQETSKLIDYSMPAQLEVTT